MTMLLNSNDFIDIKQDPTKKLRKIFNITVKNVKVLTKKKQQLVIANNR